MLIFYCFTEVALGNKFGTPDASFNASNPFVFYIEDEFTGNVLFVGKIENPTQIEQLPFPEELSMPTRMAPNPEPESASTPEQLGMVQDVKLPGVR